jgi:hypothetical protein
MGKTKMKGEVKRATLFRVSLEGGVTRQLRIRCPWHRFKRVGYSAGAINSGLVLKRLTLGENARAWRYPKGTLPKTLLVSIALKSDPAWIKEGKAWAAVRNSISARMNIYQYGSCCFVKIFLSSNKQQQLKAQPTT